MTAVKVRRKAGRPPAGVAGARASEYPQLAVRVPAETIRQCADWRQPPRYRNGRSCARRSRRCTGSDAARWPAPSSAALSIAVTCCRSQAARAGVLLGAIPDDRSCNTIDGPRTLPPVSSGHVPESQMAGARCWRNRCLGLYPVLDPGGSCLERVARVGPGEVVRRARQGIQHPHCETRCRNQRAR